MKPPTASTLLTLEQRAEEISRIIQTLDQHKVHKHDAIFVTIMMWMGISGLSMIRFFQMLFNNCLKQGVFPNIWKTAKVITVNKENRKQLVDNYRPISLLPICSKIIEKLLFNSIYEFLDENCLGNSYT